MWSLSLVHSSLYETRKLSVKQKIPSQHFSEWLTDFRTWAQIFASILSLPAETPRLGQGM